MTKIYYYNITFNVDNSVLNSWKSYIKNELGIELIENSNFLSLSLMRVNNSEKDIEQIFALLLKTDKLENIWNFKKNMEEEISLELKRRFGNKVLTFSTFMREEFSL